MGCIGTGHCSWGKKFHFQRQEHVISALNQTPMRGHHSVSYGWAWSSPTVHPNTRSVAAFVRLCIFPGWWFQPTPLKNDGVNVSWDDDIPNIWKTYSKAVFIPISGTHFRNFNWWLIFAEAFPDGFQIPTTWKAAQQRSRRWELGKTYGDLLILMVISWWV